ncbi:MAG: hypothetical protein FJ304_22835 [Planctomycetes bacterium]|nr:hypothetical protein [Planctomycetota bacterium]
MEALEVAREALFSLLENRDFLGYQLAHANGSLSDQEMDAIADAFFGTAPVFDESAVARKAAFLAGIIQERLDPELVSTVFRCELGQAERAIAIATKNIGTFLPEAAETKELGR